MNFYQHAFTRLSLLSLIIFSLPVFAQTSNTCQADIPIHQWGENDRQGTLGDIYIYNNPYNQDTEYFKLNELGSDGRYWYFPTEKKNNKYWKYLGQGKPDNRLHHWDDDNRLGGISNIYLNEVDGQSRYYRLRKLNKHDRYKAFPKKNKRSNKYWKYRGNTQPKRICDENTEAKLTIESDLLNQATNENGVAILNVGDKLDYGLSLSYLPGVQGDNGTMTLTQTISPESGLDFKSYHDSPWTIPANSTTPLTVVNNINLEALALGEYTITSTLTAEPSGITIEHIDRIKVAQEVVITPGVATPLMGLRRQTVTANTIESAYFFSAAEPVINYDTETVLERTDKIKKLALHEVTAEGELIQFMGFFENLEFIEFEYEGQTLAEIKTPVYIEREIAFADDPKYFQIVAINADEKIISKSPIKKIEVTIFPIVPGGRFPTQGLDSLVPVPDWPGHSYYTDWIIISFPTDYSDNQIVALLDYFNLEVVNYMGLSTGAKLIVSNPFIGDYAKTKQLMNDIETYDSKVYTNIDLYAPNPFASFTPNEYASPSDVPYEIPTMRLDQLWYLSQKGSSHAKGYVVDSGLVVGHPDIIIDKKRSYSVSLGNKDVAPTPSAIGKYRFYQHTTAA